MRIFAFASGALCVALAALPAHAHGTVRIQPKTGTVRNYQGVTFHVAGKTLRMTSSDKKGTLVVTDAACTYVDGLLRCLPYAVVLNQDGAHPIAITSGTIYFNPTQQAQQLRHSSTRIPPNGVLGTMRTEHGTYVTMTGTLDGRSK